MKFSKALIEPFRRIRRYLTSEALIRFFRKISRFFSSGTARMIGILFGLIFFIFFPPVTFGVGLHHLFGESSFIFVSSTVFTILWVCYSLWVLMWWGTD